MSRLKNLGVVALGLSMWMGASACSGGDTNNGNNVTANNQLPYGGDIVQSAKQRITQPNVPSAQMETLEEGNTGFALGLYQQVKDQDQGDLFFSPFSISIALAMTYAGAKGDTAAEMKSTLQFLLADQELHPAFNQLDLALASRGQGATNKDGEPFQLSVANSIWGRKNYEFLDEFLDVLALNYGAGLRTLDFVEDPDGSRKVINEWVEAKTEDRIKDLLPEGSIDSGVVLVLTNAIYFNAAWLHKFEENSTRDGDFTTLAGSTKSVKMMYQMENFRYAEGTLGTTNYQALELPYDGEEMSMLLILPEDFSAGEAALDSTALTGVLEGLEPKMVEVSMPKFKIEQRLKVKQALIDMGMELPFSGAADFSGINGTGGLYIDNIYHKAFGLVDESGTEAAAATAVVIRETSAPQADEVFTADKPFLVLIRDNATGTVLFIGRVADPKI